jgi:pimeloyl-ACP methyl ester carboxylesterase
MSRSVFHRTALVRERKIFYREAGDPSAPTILLLHGLPGSSADYRNLITALDDSFHLIAPDYVGFGGSETPLPDAFEYTFENLSAYVEALVDAIGLKSYMLYMHDCGGPIGFRLFVRDPHRVTGFIIQNANAYVEGVSNACFRALAPLWDSRNLKTELAAQQFVSLVHPGPLAADTPPVGRSKAGFSGPMQFKTSPGLLDLLEDYRTNVALYPNWQSAFREHAPPTLIIWGKHDPVFIPPGARAYLDDLPEAKLVWLDAGHSVLEQNWEQVAAQIKAAFVPFLVAPSPTLIVARKRGRAQSNQSIPRLSEADRVRTKV